MNLRDVILLDQQPIGKTPRSNPVTYVDAFGPIRKLFAQTSRARLAGYRRGVAADRGRRLKLLADPVDQVEDLLNRARAVSSLDDQ